MDIEQLHNDIWSAYDNDPLTSAQLPQPSDPKLTLSDSLLCLNDRIFVPDSQDLRLRIMKHMHDHLLSEHLGQNKTLELVRCEYVWPGMRAFIKDYCNSCTTCK
jgi:hypothetical protein